ncbi:glutathione S-transferase, partial [Paragonimus westermani]
NGFEFQHPPYYQDGNLELTQSLATLRYTAGEHKMLGSMLEQRAMISMFEVALGDLCSGVLRIAYNEEFEERKAENLKSMPTTLSIWSKFLRGKSDFQHSMPSHLDFMFNEAFDVLHYVQPTYLAACIALGLF